MTKHKKGKNSTKTVVGAVPRLRNYLVILSLLLLATASANHDDDLRALSLKHQQEVRPPSAAKTASCALC